MFRARPNSKEKPFLCAFTFIFVLSTLSSVLTEDSLVYASTLELPVPGQMLELSDQFSDPVLKGLKLDPNNPLNIEFVVDMQDKQSLSEEEGSLLVSYFLAALTTPQENLWVNLSPYEKNRIIEQNFSQTDMGKDLLAQDYILKQIASSLTNPNTELGKNYWNKAAECSDLSKIWIMPDTAELVENASAVVIKSSRLKIVSEESPLSELLPVIAEEVNQGKSFSKLRQVYSALVLGLWFKKKFENSFYKHYIDKSKINGIDIDDKEIKNKIYKLYNEAFSKGAYNVSIKERDANNKLMKKNYFSGGFHAQGWQPKTKTMASAIELEEAFGNNTLKKLNTKLNSALRNNKKEESDSKLLSSSLVNDIKHMRENVVIFLEDIEDVIPEKFLDAVGRSWEKDIKSVDDHKKFYDLNIKLITMLEKKKYNRSNIHLFKQCFRNVYLAAFAQKKIEYSEKTLEDLFANFPLWFFKYKKRELNNLDKYLVKAVAKQWDLWPQLLNVKTVHHGNKEGLDYDFDITELKNVLKENYAPTELMNVFEQRNFSKSVSRKYLKSKLGKAFESFASLVLSLYYNPSGDAEEYIEYLLQPNSAVDQVFIEDGKRNIFECKLDPYSASFENQIRNWLESPYIKNLSRKDFKVVYFYDPADVIVDRSMDTVERINIKFFLEALEEKAPDYYDNLHSIYTRLREINTDIESNAELTLVDELEFLENNFSRAYFTRIIEAEGFYADYFLNEFLEQTKVALAEKKYTDFVFEKELDENWAYTADMLNVAYSPAKKEYMEFDNSNDMDLQAWDTFSKNYLSKLDISQQMNFRKQFMKVYARFGTNNFQPENYVSFVDLLAETFKQLEDMANTVELNELRIMFWLEIAKLSFMPQIRFENHKVDNILRKASKLWPSKVDLSVMLFDYSQDFQNYLSKSMQSYAGIIAEIPGLIRHGREFRFDEKVLKLQLTGSIFKDDFWGAVKGTDERVAFSFYEDFDSAEEKEEEKQNRISSSVEQKTGGVDFRELGINNSSAIALENLDIDFDNFSGFVFELKSVENVSSARNLSESWVN